MPGLHRGRCSICGGVDPEGQVTWVALELDDALNGLQHQLQAVAVALRQLQCSFRLGQLRRRLCGSCRRPGLPPASTRQLFLQTLRP